jgi:low temperature requirement protein LtrA
VTDLPISWPIIVAATLGLSVSASLWWVYFDTSALLGEHSLAQARGEHRVSMARTAFTYLHLPMMGGIVLLALGLKKVLEYVGDAEHHTLSDPLEGVPLWAMYGGVVLYLLALVAFSLRCYRNLKIFRLVAAGVILALVPLAATLPALATLGLLAIVLIGLNVAEMIRFADDRQALRHGNPEDVHKE